MMMAGINKTHFGGRQVVTCYLLPSRQRSPEGHAEPADALWRPPARRPERHHRAGAATRRQPTQVLDKYIQALGGAQRLAALTSFVAKGTSVGYGPEAQKRPVEIFARAPGQRTTIIHTASGDSTTTYDGARRLDCRAAQAGAGARADGARSRRRQAGCGASFPARIKRR